MQHADLKPVVAPITPAPVCRAVEPLGNGAIVAIIPPEEERPIPVTELIFAPLNKNMNKGFFMPLQDEGHTSELHLHFRRFAIEYCLTVFSWPT